MNKLYKHAFGLWSVSTEGDCEGRSTTYLGVHKGFLDEIALHLADKAYYSLKFALQDPVEDYAPTKGEVHVQLDIGSDTWGSIKSEDGLNEVSEVFEDRPVTIEPSKYYASFKIKSKKSNAVLRDIQMKTALAKLTSAEIKMLGLDQVS